MKEFLEKLKAAVIQDNKIICKKSDIGNHTGCDEAYLESLGLHKKHLIRLQRLGLAIKARTKNIWLPGEILPNGKVVPEGQTYRANGSKTKWILLQLE